MDLKEKASKLPSLPGCYLMLKDKQIIYIGKAKNLKKRVLSYFGVTTGKTYFLMQHVDDFDFFLTSNEAEALLLENNLIKKHRPKYNVSLKDDRRFPFVQVNTKEEFPILRYVRRPIFKKGMKTYGPFVAGSRIPEILIILNDHFKLRTCNNLKKTKNPCLRFHLNLCSGPCCYQQEDYQVRLEEATKLFGSSRKQIVTMLTKKMTEVSDKEEFEAAAKIRDDLSVISDFFKHMAKQKVEYLNVKNLDVISYYEGKEAIDIVILVVRNGFLIGKQNFFIYDKEELVDLIFGYYEKNSEIPPLIDWRGELLLIDSLKLIGDVKLFHFDELSKLASKTAMENQRLRESFKYTRMEALKKLARLIKSKPLFLLEAYDVAIFSGKSPTASKVVFYQGYPHKQEYRYYTLQERPEGNNDFAMLEEVLLRRLQESNLPDLFIVDGGRPQLRVFSKVLRSKNIDVPLIAIAKTKGDKEERIYFKDEEFILKDDPAVLSLITAIRDEAHRFAQKLFKKHETKRIFNA